jgi:hypothetical protein
MRRIEIRRADKVVATLDIYDYPLREASGTTSASKPVTSYMRCTASASRSPGRCSAPRSTSWRRGNPRRSGASSGAFRADAALDRLSIYRIVPLPSCGSGPFPRVVMAVPWLHSRRPTPLPSCTDAGDAVGSVLVQGSGSRTRDSVFVDVVPSLDVSL